MVTRCECLLCLCLSTRVIEALGRLIVLSVKLVSDRSDLRALGMIVAVLVVRSSFVRVLLCVWVQRGMLGSSV